jgi:3-oxoacyl-[acyl-carrier protein] reductase
MSEGKELAGQELAGKVAIVTGAGRNIGRAIALHLAAGGAAVLVNARSNKAEADAVAAEIKAAGGKAIAFLADVADAAAVEAMAQAALKAFGRIDILVNNASLRREKPIDEMSYAEWREIMDATLDSAFHGVHACLPAMKKNGGTIINIGGMSAHSGSKGRAHVMTAKAGVVGFSRALAHDLGAYHITANCVVPGAIHTTRPRSSLNPAHHLTHGTITGEPGKPDDVAAMVRFLAGPGGRNVTGQTIHVNGGAFLG